jgi:hypothetical protein
MDPSSITALLAAGSHAVRLLKTAGEAMKAAGKSEAIAPIVEAQMAMMDVLQKQQELIDDNRRLADEAANLREALEVSGSLEYRHSAYWRKTQDSRLDGPFLASGWDRDRRLVRMARWGRGVHGDGEKIQFYDRVSREEVYVPVSFLTERNAVVLDDEPENARRR